MSWTRHFALGPLLWGRVEPAEHTDRLRQSPWERGVVSAAEFVDNNRGGFGPALAVLFAVAGLFVVPGPWLLKVPAAALIGLGVAWCVPTLIAATVAFLAPPKQRDEARRRVDDWEAFFAQDELWSARVRLAYEVNANIALQARWLETQGAHPLPNAVEDWRRRGEGWIGVLRELGDNHTADHVAQLLDELDGALDIAAANEVMLRLGTDLLNASHGGRAAPPERTHT